MINQPNILFHESICYLKPFLYKQARKETKSVLLHTNFKICELTQWLYKKYSKPVFFYSFLIIIFSNLNKYKKYVLKVPFLLVDRIQQHSNSTPLEFNTMNQIQDHSPSKTPRFNSGHKTKK